MIKRKICKRCNGTGKTYDKPKNIDGIIGFGRFKFNTTNSKGCTCKSCNGTGYRG